MAKVKAKYAGKYQKAKFTKKIFSDQLVKHQDNIRHSLQSHGREVKAELKKVITTSVGNGVHYPGLPNRSSSPGNTPASQSGKLADSFLYRISPMQLIVANKADNQGAPYATFLEEGTKKMEARPYFQCTIESLHYRLYKDLQDLTK